MAEVEERTSSPYTLTKIPSWESSPPAFISDKCFLAGSSHLPQQHHPDISKYCPSICSIYCGVNWNSWTIARGLQNSDMLTHRDPCRVNHEGVFVMNLSSGPEIFIPLIGYKHRNTSALTYLITEKDISVGSAFQNGVAWRTKMENV